MSGTVFKSAGYPWRLFCGPGAIEAHLPAAVARAGASRAMVICSPSVAAKTSVVDRIRAALGGKLAGVFDGIQKDSSYASVCAAKAAAEEARADLLIAVGGGSVIVGVRAVSIFMSEAGDPFELMTQYPEGGRPYSPRLEAPKIPIINIPTTPTSAMNRAGTGLKNPNLDHRMEYFDPKTRPQSLFLDDEVLLATPDAVLRSTATTVFAGLAAAISLSGLNPLVEADQREAFRLACRAYVRLCDAAGDAGVRRNLALAAFLQNRAEDDGRPVVLRGPFSSDYAVSTALHLLYPSIGQGEATAVVHASAIRRSAMIGLPEARATAEALEVWCDGMDAAAATEAVASRLEALYAANGMPVRLQDAGVPREGLADIAAATVKNFNARTGLISAEERVAASLGLLEAAW